jgi:hypothetical protein
MRTQAVEGVVPFKNGSIKIMKNKGALEGANEEKVLIIISKKDTEARCFVG